MIQIEPDPSQPFLGFCFFVEAGNASSHEKGLADLGYKYALPLEISRMKLQEAEMFGGKHEYRISGAIAFFKDISDFPNILGDEDSYEIPMLERRTSFTDVSTREYLPGVSFYSGGIDGKQLKEWIEFHEPEIKDVRENDGQTNWLMLSSAL